MGIVYEGEHPVIGRKVAIKILRPDFAEGGRARDLASEARAASAIRHRGIIDIFGFGNIPGVGQYLVMEYLDGLPLDEVINQRAPMLEREVVTILDELLAALEAAHAVGVIHRDLKPGNVFLVRDGTGNESVKVLDFGLAKRSEAPYGSTPQTRQSMMVGTPEYMAPEQACGQQVGPHTDLYAVGVIAFEMLTRRLPFEGESPMAIAVHHVRTPPPPPSTYVELHPAMESLVMRLLEKDAADRPPSAEAVRRELKNVLDLITGDATQLAPPPMVSPASTISQEAVAVTMAPTPRVRTERFGPQPQPQSPPRRPAPKGASSPPAKVSAPPRRATPAKVDLYNDKTTAMDLDALNAVTAPPHRSRAVMAAVGGALLLAVVTGGLMLMSSGEASVTPTPGVLQTGTGLRAHPPAPGQPTVAATPPAPAAAAGNPQPPPTGEARPAVAQGAAPEPTLTQGTEVTRSPDEGGAAATPKPGRPTVTQREGRVPRTAQGTGDETHTVEKPSVEPPGMGWLTLQVEGNVQEVLINGKSFGRKQSKLRLPEGEHAIEVRGNVKTYQGTVTIFADETIVRELSLK
jgi:serine/threonine-protein kinase